MTFRCPTKIRKTLLFLLLSLFSTGVFAGESIFTLKTAVLPSHSQTTLRAPASDGKHGSGNLKGSDRVSLPFLRGNETNDFLSRISRQQNTTSANTCVPLKAIGLLQPPVVANRACAAAVESVAKYRRVRIAAHTGWV